MRSLRSVWVSAMLLSACVGGGPRGIVGAVGVGLPAFSDCRDLLEHVQDRALEHVTAWGIGGSGGFWALPFAAEGSAVAATGGDARAIGVPAPDHSTTNVQTQGIDEPDIVKTDGERIVVVTGDRLVVLDAAGGVPELRGTLRFEGMWPRDLLLLGDRALVLGDRDEGATPVAEDVAFSPGTWAPGAALVEVDLSDDDAPRIARRLLLDGRYLSARMRDGVARVVISSAPTGLPFEFPTRSGLREERAVEAHNREVVRASSIEDWLPAFVLEGPDGEIEAEGALLGCDAARRPMEYAGLDMLSVLTVDLDEGLDGDVAERATGVLAAGETVYASAESLYVATQRWFDPTAFERGIAPREGTVTQIHRFDTAGDGPAEYRATGEVPGWLLNQFSMDEFEGHLRVASTDAPPFWDGPTESMVTTLAERDGALVEVGRVEGLGRGERIFAVRFLADLGYVVTFREIDPLYVVDLSDPAAPTVEGELKIPGYSAYLHPLEDGLLLGVGQEATLQGRLQGTQMSLFDVSDPSDPRRIDQVKIAGGTTEAEWDHRAFLLWEDLAVIPVTVYDHAPGATPFSGAVAVRVTGGGLEEAGRIEHALERPGYSSIRRALVIGDLLLTVSDAGVEAVDLDTLEPVARVGFSGAS